ncbi:cyclic di-GMP phosphodiesterase CdpA [Pandoraea terrae]
MVELTGGLSAHVTAEGRFLFIADTSLRFLEYSREYVDHASLFELTGIDDVPVVQEALAAAQTQGPQHCTVRLLRGLTDRLWMQLHIALYSPRTRTLPATFVVRGVDITAQKDSEQRLRELALCDTVTGLGNRGYIQERIAGAIAHANDGGPNFAVALLDLDGFKKVNDSLGHDVGDQLLRAAGQRLVAQIRETDVAGRMGGDEFVLVLPGCDDEQALNGIMKRVLSAIQQPFQVGDQMLHLTTSIGVAFYPRHGTSDGTLIKHADAAMYCAKDRGRNGLYVYTDDLGDLQRKAFSLESAMFEAIHNGEFSLHYQPICDPVTLAVKGVEALMRWYPALGPVSPAEFIPLAEANGLINLLGGWALRAACMQLARWDTTRLGGLYMSVNVSAQQFHHPAFPSLVWQAIADSGVEGHRLVLEITESVLMRDPEQANLVLRELQTLGVRFAVDDFGAGYSSLGYLKRFPLSALKIDRSFVKDMPTSSNDRTIVTAVLGLARELGLSAVAEGVETEEQRQMLIDRGCDSIQGWLVSQALPANELEGAFASGSLHLEGGR